MLVTEMLKSGEYIQDFIEDATTMQFGKYFGHLVDGSFGEDYVNERLRNAGSNVRIDTDLNRPDSNNDAGYDAELYDINNPEKRVRVQIKFRNQPSKYPTSGSLHFETTRRNSEKNSGKKSDTGHVAYSAEEFDVVLVFICHTQSNCTGPDNDREDFDNWHLCAIDVDWVRDPETPDICQTTIPSSALQRGEDWVSVLENSV